MTKKARQKRYTVRHGETLLVDGTEVRVNMNRKGRKAITLEVRGAQSLRMKKRGIRTPVQKKGESGHS